MEMFLTYIRVNMFLLQVEGQKFLTENSASVYIEKVCWLLRLYCQNKGQSCWSLIQIFY